MSTKAGDPAGVRPSAGWLLPCGLSFVAAWTDTVSFVALLGLFTAHVTGNFVVIGSAIVGTGIEPGGLVAKLMALPVFALGAAAATWIVRRRERVGRPTLRLVVLIEAGLLAAFLAFGIGAAPVIDSNEPWALAAATFALLAMGLQNAAGRLILVKSAPTTVMTVNVTQAVVDLVDFASDRADDAGREARLRLYRIVPSIVAFTIGALAAALAWRSFGFACLIVPIGMLVVVAVTARDGDR